jgi:hypothetical protein
MMPHRRAAGIRDTSSRIVMREIGTDASRF